MHSRINRLSLWLSHAGPTRVCGAFCIINYTQLVQAYGQESIQSGLRARLAAYGIADVDVLILDYFVLVRVSHVSVFNVSDEILCSDVLAQHLSYTPVRCGQCDALMHICPVGLDADLSIKSEADLSLKRVLSRMQAAARAVARVESELSAPEQIRGDMVQACRFLQQLQDHEILLSFHDMGLTHVEPISLIYKTQLHHAKSSGGQPASCDDAVAALRRLHLSERLDVSVVWTVVQLLREQPEIKLSCRLSLQSLSSGCWWYSVLSHLEDLPELTSRVSLEIAETDRVVSVAEALEIASCRDSTDVLKSLYTDWSTEVSVVLSCFTPCLDQHSDWLRRSAFVKDFLNPQLALRPHHASVAWH